MEEERDNPSNNSKPWLFKKGQPSANPLGRPKGKTMKEWAKEYLARLPEEERFDFLDGLPKEVVWKMAEGNAHNTDESKVEITAPKPLLDALFNNNSNKEDSQPKE